MKRLSVGIALMVVLVCGPARPSFAEQPFFALVGDTSTRTGVDSKEGANGNAALGLELELPKLGILASIGYGVSSTLSDALDDQFRKGIARAIEGGFGGVLDLRVSPWGTFDPAAYTAISGLYARVRIPYWSYNVPSTATPPPPAEAFQLLAPRLTVGYWADIKGIAIKGGIPQAKLDAWDTLGIGLEFGVTSRTVEGNSEAQMALGNTTRVGVVTSFYIVVNALRVQLDVPCFFSSLGGLNSCVATVGIGGRADILSSR